MPSSTARWSAELAVSAGKEHSALQGGRGSMCEVVGGATSCTRRAGAAEHTAVAARELLPVSWEYASLASPSRVLVGAGGGR